MQTFDPTSLQVEIKNPRLNKGEDTIDVDTVISAIDAQELAVAYCRLPKRMIAFLQYTCEHYTVIGFSYDFEGKSREFGVIIKANVEEEDHDI
jgi:hypothetical protein